MIPAFADSDMAMDNKINKLKIQGFDPFEIILPARVDLSDFAILRCSSFFSGHGIEVTTVYQVD